MEWLLFVLVIIAVVWFRKKNVKKAEHVGGAQKVVLQPNDTDNPWMQRVFSSPAYGLIPSNITSLMKRVSADENEKVIGAIYTWHGRLQRLGYLVLTTHYLRYIQFFPLREDEFWVHDTVLHKESNIEKRLSVHDRMFQAISSRRRVNAFQKMYKDLQQALFHEESKAAEAEQKHQEAKAAPVSSVSDELERLVALHQQGMLSDGEFRHAKQRILGRQETHREPAKQHKRVM
jgi:Sec-independent protein translocase protein TatA